jgi:hypothetical protein
MDSKSKAELPGGAPPRTRRARWPAILAGIVFIKLLHSTMPGFPFYFGCRLPGNSLQSFPPAAAAACPQESPLVPSKNSALWDSLTTLHATDAFLERAVGQLSAAVQIPTETFDAMGPVGEDERWATRGPFMDHLVTAFPLV